MTIPASAQPTPIVPPSAGQRFTDDKGFLTNTGRIALQQLRDYIVNMCRTFPCNASTTSNVITLTLLAVQPTLVQYADFDTFGFIADATSTGLLTANVVTAGGALATLNVYKTNGGAQATTGDVTITRQYFLTYVDSLNANAGGFVLR
jgi:hypothetical protein